MKITIKTVQQKVFQIDAEAGETVGDVKKRIEEAHSHPVANQKLIYAGKVLSDDKTLEACEIKEKDFLVLMVSKPKPSVTSGATSSQPVPPAQPAQLAQPASTEPAPQPAQPTTEQSSQTTAAGPSNGFLTGSVLNDAINNMVEMGFPRDQVLKAMRASYNNPDRAVEYLTSGFPTHLETEHAPQPIQLQSPQPAANTPAVQQPTQQTASRNLFQLAEQQQSQAEGGGTAIPNAAQNPQMTQLREAIAQNPAMLQPLIQQLAASNPGMAQALAQNPEQLFNLLRSGDGDEGGIPPGAQVVHVTPEEQSAIERLEALGFTRQQVVEAYFACDKNEELAANYLFEGGFEE